MPKKTTTSTVTTTLAEARRPDLADHPGYAAAVERVQALEQRRKDVSEQIEAIRQRRRTAAATAATVLAQTGELRPEDVADPLPGLHRELSITDRAAELANDALQQSLTRALGDLGPAYADLYLPAAARVADALAELRAALEGEADAITSLPGWIRPWFAPRRANFAEMPPIFGDRPGRPRTWAIHLALKRIAKVWPSLAADIREES